MMIGEIQSQMDENIARVVQNVVISVDKDELVKAMNYDRGQYEKGYIDGKNDVVAHGHWIRDGVFNDCSVCGMPYIQPHINGNPTFKYCPNCNAKMDEVD